MSTMNATVTITSITANTGGSSGNGADGKSAYQSWLDQGNTGTEQDFINSLKGEPGEPGDPGKPGKSGDLGKPGDNGKSAYQTWLERGNAGTEVDFINSLKGEPGEPGKEAYQTWLELGNEGDREAFIAALKGEPGESGVVVGEGLPNRLPEFDGEIWRDVSRNYGIGTWVGDGVHWLPGVGVHVEQIDTDQGAMFVTMAGDHVTLSMSAFYASGENVKDLLVPLPEWIKSPDGVLTNFVSAYVPDGSYYKEIPAKVVTGITNSVSLPGEFSVIEIRGGFDLAPGSFYDYFAPVTLEDSEA